ncbi:TPA: hypothetical protein DDZ86_01355 [Candidatus Dependentiae bacterium]|nr:MAG: hypothetical protein UW09_C0004G0152 [candidate division TM6 bacterium GW2011_GWF2_43_87]HBL98273.1 hypothetical protein [Candidatus Dependentiae bacterium]
MVNLSPTALLYIFGGYALFASATTLNKLILFHLPPLFYVGIRMLASGIIILTYQAFKSPRMKMCHLKPDIKHLLVIGAFTTFLPSVLKAFALKNLISSKATLIASMDPFVTALYAYFLWGERMSRSQILGIAISFAGIVILLWTTSPAEASFFSIGILSLPEIAAFVSMVIARYGWILAQRVIHSERYTPTELNGLIMLIGGSYALITSTLTENVDFNAIPTTWTFWAVCLYSITIANILGYSIYGTLLKKYPITLTSLCGISIPLFVHLYGPLILGEPLSLTFFVSLAFVALGTYLFIQNKSTQTKTPVVKE